MKLITAATLFAGIAPAAAVPSKKYFFDTIPASQELVWYPCNQTFECARLSVPLNPLEPNNGFRNEIPIVRYPAEKSYEYKGMILTNPGGPGISGTNFILQAGMLVANLVGGGWDVIGFDPRGTGYSKPNGAVGFEDIPLTPELQNATSIQQGQIIKRSKEADNLGIEIPPVPDSWIQKQYEIGTKLNTLMQKNANADNQALPYMTTPNVAFDMLQIAKADARSRGSSDENVLVNYYGISYGTVIGQTFASLYPNHVGRFVLDAVVDMEGHYAGKVGLTRFDEGIANFFTSCFNSGPEECSFYTGHTRDDIRIRFNNLMAQFDISKAIAGKWENATVIQEAREIIMGQLVSAPYDTMANFPVLAEFLEMLEQLVEEGSLLENRRMLLTWTPEQMSLPDRKEYFFEILCSDMDNKLVGSNQLSNDFIDTLRQSSVISGASHISQYAICSRLQLKAKWKFNGKIGGDTKNPMLFVGSSGDPITVFENAERAQKLYKGSQMIFVESDAHGILGQSNECAYDHVRAYFQNLTLPGQNNNCSRDGTPSEYSHTPKKSGAGLSRLESLNTLKCGILSMTLLLVGFDVFGYII
ncbi:hypothetical protein TWF730_002791 [Orbilia blumenaviensis]|uniref:Peptidase S33 tripeptidyl aminopeptidase-like C-terminal domain-containing protein n=1 Tax=Orbilia blumenaviensis TaxID=1796055 RepID=A0AAV9UBM3_9PEZI